jgi:hypothetical protein
MNMLTSSKRTSRSSRDVLQQAEDYGSHAFQQFLKSRHERDVPVTTTTSMSIPRMSGSSYVVY